MVLYLTNLHAVGGATFTADGYNVTVILSHDEWVTAGRPSWVDLNFERRD